jgi:phage terminase small subunit
MIPAMRPPQGLDPAARAAWTRAAGVLADIGEDVELNAEPLRLYAVAAGELAALRRAWATDGRATVRSAHGGEVAHPLLKAVEVHARLVADLGRALGLTPEGRRRSGRSVRGGRPPGAASAPDRAAVPRRSLLRSVQ